MNFHTKRWQFEIYLCAAAMSELNQNTCPNWSEYPSGYARRRFAGFFIGAGGILKPGGIIAETTSPMDLDELISKYAFGDIKKDDIKESK